jgi:hypothetical protein
MDDAMRRQRHLALYRANQGGRRSISTRFGSHLCYIQTEALPEIMSLSFLPTPGEYYRRQADRVRSLAHNATTPAIRKHLADVVLQYEKLAEGAEAGYRDPQ